MRKFRCVMAVTLLLSFFVVACNKKQVITEESDWRDRYGTVQNSEITSEPMVTSSVQERPATTTPKPGHRYPTPAPVPEFIPRDGQVELVLFEPDASISSLDEYVVAALNLWLQERGYSFYLTVLEEELKVMELSKWQERIDSGEQIDLIYFTGEDRTGTYDAYGEVNLIRAIQGGYLLPFSEYPDIEAKQSLWEAYPDSYWELSSFKGEIYGISEEVSDLIRNKCYVMLNLDAAERIGLTITEQLELTNLDALLQQAEDAGIPAIYGLSGMEYSGIQILLSGLYLKYDGKGEYRIVNPMEDSRLLSLWDAVHRYVQNGWEQFDPTREEEFPLIACVDGNGSNWQGNVYTMENQDGKASAKVKVYEELPKCFVEGDMYGLMGITSASEHKEEALELLNLMHSNEEVVKLLRYGLEGIHYQINETGELEITEGWGLFKASIGNRLMYLEFEEMLGKENTEEAYYEGISEIEKIPYMEDFTEEQKEQLKKIRAVTYTRLGPNGMSGFMNEASYIVNASKSDYREEIEKKTVAFAEAGYNELAEEVNKKYGLE